jgi:hypothetical protein
LPREIFRCWVHSHEEDTAKVCVYRPRGHPLPPARGRTAFELHRNGRFVHHGIAAGEGGQAIVGRWTAEAPDQVRIEFPAGAAGARGLPKLLTIEACDAQRLEIRR